MIRRRPQSDLDPSSPTSVPSSYEKDNKERGGIRYFGITLGVTGTIFVLFLLVIADYLDSVKIRSANPQFGPNNLGHGNATIVNDNDNDGDSQRKSKGNTHDIVINNIINNNNSIPLATTDSHSDDEMIPFIRYDPLIVETVKKRMDYASSHGDASNPNNPNNTIGQYLLDFGIIGFPKCGTTTMMKWLNMHEKIAVLGQEDMALQKDHPVRILRHITKLLPEGRYRRGYKSPSDVEDGRARNKLGIHYPETKLLVGIRHPVLWFESFYNHRVQNNNIMPNLTEYASKKNAIRCVSEWRGVCFSRARFHKILAKWGKTPLLALSGDKKRYESYYDANSGYERKDEWKIFSKEDQRQLKNEVNKTVISPNPIFLYDVGQLHMPNANETIRQQEHEQQQEQQYYEDFVESLQEFLGVPKNATAMPAMIREKPGKVEGINTTEQSRLDGLKIDICDEKFEVPRLWLIEIGAGVAEWITKYFAKSPHGVFLGGGSGSGVSSSKIRFLEILESYGKDPCPERRSRNQKGR